MKNPVIPYALTAALGILLVIVISVVGLNQQEAIQDEQNGEEKQGEEQQEKSQDEGSGGGETAANGEEIFQSNCASCHGSDLSGGVGPDLTSVGSDYSKEEIKEIIANGFPPNMPAGIVKGKKADALAQWLSEQK